MRLSNHTFGNCLAFIIVIINNISCPNFTLTSSFSLNNAVSPRKSLLTYHLEIIFPKRAWHLVCLSCCRFPGIMVIGHCVYMSWFSGVEPCLIYPYLTGSPGEGKGYPLQYSGLENSIDCIVHEITKLLILLSDFHFQIFHNNSKYQLCT